MDRRAVNPDVWVLAPSGAHGDFREPLALLQAGTRARMIFAVDDAHLRIARAAPPALIVVAQSRPGEVRRRDVERLRRQVPLAGVVSLLGSWCEGESRTGRPLPDAVRLYWYEFPAWWRRQVALLAAGRCPDWARWGNGGSRIDDGGLYSQSSCNPKPAFRNGENGLVVLNVPCWDTADALSDVLSAAGYATLWQPPGRAPLQFRGAVAGVWEGGQLDDQEADALAQFCRQLARGGAPVLALLDFPRRDGTQRASQLGAMAVLGKPWLNADLLATIEHLAAAKTLASSPNAICVA